MTDHTTLHIDCQPADKARWLLSASAQGVPLEQWVANTLNAAAIDTAWTAGLTDRATTCLVCAGFRSRADVADALRNPDYNWRAIPNFGNKCKREIEGWIND